ncbi:transposase [Candidatus Eisenbacteria bacterium]|uniref:Transposase n=1 Tax=Eiseniibacteriota bacterium TaxID=2212470 RepID=A0ABV6YNW2_UNCEI
MTRYDSLFQRRYGYLRPVVREVVERYLDCANPMCGFARIRCPECTSEYLLTFSCKTRHFCPSCHAKRREAWSIWLGRHLLIGVPHRQVVFTIPKIIRPFFRYRRALLSDLCMCAVRALSQYMRACAGMDLMPGVVAVIQTFGNRLNFHPHLHMLVTEGGLTGAGSFLPIPVFDDAALTRIFAHEVLSLLVSGELLSPEIREKILSWRHSGFNTHSKVRTTTLEDARMVARYMAKPILALWRLSFNEEEGKVIYQYGDSDAERVEMDYLEFIARATAHIPDKGQVMMRYYGLYSNAHRGKEKKRGQGTSAIEAPASPPAMRASPGWRDLIRRVYETDPLKCPSCGALMKVISFITRHAVIDEIVQHLGIKFVCQRPPPAVGQEELY